MQYKKLWIALGLVMAISFAVLGVVGYKGMRSGPPTPGKVVTADGRVLFTGETIRNGQNVWQSTGGQEIGTIWGHGAYVAPDWSADYLHRQSVIVLDRWAKQQGFANFAAMPAEQRAALQGRLTEVTRHNSYDPATDTLVLDNDRAAAFDELAAYYADIYGNGRDAYAIPPGALTDATKQHEMATFFWWTAWAASTNRPGQDVYLHTELAARRTDRQSADGRHRGLERHQFCPAAGGRRRHGLVFRFAGSRAVRQASCRNAILCSGCSPRPRKKLQSSTSSWWLRSGWCK